MLCGKDFFWIFMKEQTPHIYLLLGPEVGQKTDFIRQLYKEISALEPNVEQYKFYPYDSQMSEIITIIQTPGLFQEKRFLHLANLEDFEATQLEQLIQTLSSVSPDVWVVMSSNQTQLAKIHKKIDQVVPAKNKRIFWEMFESRKHEWIQTFFQKEGIKISPEAIERLLSLVENNTQELGVACEALAGYFHDKMVINEEDVSLFIVHSREESVYTLFSYIIHADLNAVCESLTSLALSAEGVGVQTLTRLVWQFRKVMRLKELLEEGLSLEAAAKQQMILGKHQVELYKKAAHRFSLPRLREILIQFSQYDTLLRSNYPKNLQKTIVESFLVSLCQQSVVHRA